MTNIEYVTLNSRYSADYWTEVTKLVRYDFGVGRIIEPATVRQGLGDIFSFLLDCFEDVAARARSVGFLMFVHRMHESSVLIADAFHSGNTEIEDYLSPQDLKELPNTRRVLKLVMEAILPDRFNEEIGEELRRTAQATAENVTTLEELLYLGGHALEIKEHINICTMFEKSVTLVSSWKKRLVIEVAAPYNHLFDTVKRDIARYPNVEYKEVNAELESVLNDNFSIGLNEFLEALPGLGTFIVPREEFIQEQELEAGREEAVRPFFAGLTLTAANKMPLVDSFKKMQTNNRLIYRPVLEFADRDNNVYWILGSGKTYESMNALQTNALLWGQLPKEWEASVGMQQFVQEMELRREAVMIAKVALTLDERQVKYDTSIKSLLGAKGQGFNIVKDGPGEIDTIFLDEANRVIYVCECKNNRPRFEVFYWKSEYTQFAGKYERQLTRKHEWVGQHKSLVQEHFNQKYGECFDFSSWTVEGLFLLMTVSIYKYDGSFKVMTVVDFAEFLDEGFTYEYPPLGFRRKDGSTYIINYPYFKSVHKLIAEGVL